MAWRSSFVTSILSGYLLLSFRAELAQFEAEVILMTNKVVQETRDGYPLLLRMKFRLNI
jgi:hypothetical protein